ncbi:hypothetical protein U5U50_01385 [Mycoplasma sp. 888]|uniref:hypothetical protein n=1 Tax=Mycoplasma sp. 888 TaxID=3108483 RepID=UPI002D798E72|nr:hypothetical protein [Mycoplasma sp. 888]WRQ26034.1 hypothetical protein U5U50_01385 [Mycoplasma sp. 888]
MDKKTKEKRKFIDLVEFRKNEINNARVKAQAENEVLERKKSQKALPWYKKDLTFNILGIVFTLLVMVLIILIAYFVKGA